GGHRGRGPRARLAADRVRTRTAAGARPAADARGRAGARDPGSVVPRRQGSPGRAVTGGGPWGDPVAEAPDGGAVGQSGGVTDVSGDTRLQSTVLESLSSAVRYRRWLADLARPYLGEHPIEIGSGNGDYAAEWVTPADHQPAIVSFTATEADEGRVAALARRFADHPVIRTRP